ncbi:MAG: hypothetical protein COU32_01835 [Candidatus Magasanikbacteria bacterium CG10_big_fil_rev_8_21_14_0_10_42_10]|uniref:PpiC domain-containing protein n=2 Tax=Candidatus Magasanikiibacteriota TaxID=1752731 RepID=A0A2H0TWF4_9BACT|nr:MAG: hypothetical protein COU32_01835 [Candidatus Magasanikbacteria bacterium CG10_big_fil_rev_8_21_14_0_10_42_10]PIZ93389.1 MAG: hypothetical protein COX82_02665 [Candidatus Magasanikbacteria bacterium CG_4_10_14_0_2_um_filter_41_10]
MDTQEQELQESQHEPQEVAPMESPKKKSNFMQFLAGIFIVVLIACVGVYAYTKSRIAVLSDAPFVMSVAQMFHIPIAKIEGKNIAYTDFMVDYSSLKSFYAQQENSAEPVTDADISKQVISRLLINTLMETYAKKYDVTVEQSDIDAAKTELLAQFPDEDTAATQIQTTFGWSLDTFTERVIRPIVIEQKVADAFGKDESISDTYKTTQVKARHILFTYTDDKEKASALKEAQGVLKRIQDGEDFATLAKKYGKDGTADAGGDLGWIDRGMTVPSFENVIFDLQPGQLYDSVLETEFGLHIVEVEDVRTVNDFALFYQDQLSAADVKIYTDIANPFDKTDDASLTPVSPDTNTTVTDEEVTTDTSTGEDTNN